ncbi:hypothetical protein P7K49_039471 [Saguinus oedipus]|uniref:Uncharacterized protein n=1 Tax=Saguinus oedipus TaxID=9490 RepID=A0ABQ9TC08_SAGOE|nr:hypothetical protein P7K49_039471 [Saguinus oedipus]
MKNPEAQQEVSVSQGFRVVFYTMKPSEPSFQTLEEVPDHVKKATPFLISLMLLELVVSWIRKGKPPGRLDDTLTSVSAGVLSRLPGPSCYLVHNLRPRGVPSSSFQLLCLE